jgi:RecB family exonuclease
MPEWNELHELRKNMEIRYTGESKTEDWDSNGNYHPCPSELKRELEDIYNWSRNRPKGEDTWQEH